MIRVAGLALLLLTGCANLLGPDTGVSNIEVFDNIWNEFNNSYALFDICGVDWDESYRKYSPLVNNDLSEKEFFKIVSTMLNDLNDSHVRLQSSFDYFISGGQGSSIFDLEISKKYLDEVKRVGNDNIVYGKIGSTGYIYIRTFLAEDDNWNSTLCPWAKEIDSVISYLYNCESIILDIRSNGGGLPQTALYIAQRFTDKKRVYQNISNKIGPGDKDFGESRIKYITPGGDRQYLKPVYLLTDNLTASASEDLTMALLTLPHVTQIGEATRGIFSTHIGRDLPNGWRFTLSFQKVTDNKDICYEGKGMEPMDGNRIAYNPEDRDRVIDTQLEFILKRLNHSL